MDTYILNDGNRIPKVGMGTSRLKGSGAVNVIQSAIQSGFRLIDTAFKYENEGAVGTAVRKSGVPRAELYVASKLPGRAYSRKDAIETVQESLMRSGLDYFDLYLLHWPNPERNEYLEAWQALIDMQRFGLVRSIGVSNFLPEYLDRLIDSTGVTPSVNQIQLNPYYGQKELVSYNKRHRILTEDWSPLGGAGSSVLKEPTIIQIAETHRKNVGQIVLRWELQRGTLPLPKSKNAGRQVDNLNVFDFELSAEEMTIISGLSKPETADIWMGPATTENL